MKNRTKILYICTAASLIMGCANNVAYEFASGSGAGSNGVEIRGKISKITCEKYVKFQAKTIDLKGFEMPVTFAGDQLVKIGEFAIEPQKVREVTDTVALMDNRQYEQCKILQKLKNPTPEELNNYYTKNDAFYEYVMGLLLK